MTKFKVGDYVEYERCGKTRYGEITRKVVLSNEMNVIGDVSHNLGNTVIRRGFFAVREDDNNAIFILHKNALRKTKIKVSFNRVIN